MIDRGVRPRSSRFLRARLIETNPERQGGDFPEPRGCPAS